MSRANHGKFVNPKPFHKVFSIGQRIDQIGEVLEKYD
jgi:hypothetical protein